MYTPEKFKIEDKQVVCQFIRQHPFALLLTVDHGEIHDTHTPFILSDDNNFIYGHIARANPQWGNWHKSDQVIAKVIFTGPHTYISPHDYASDFNVPTWNYTAISVSGELTMIDDENEVLEFLDKLIIANEPTQEPWKLDSKDDRSMKLLSGIIVFKVAMEKVEASFKMNQNKTTEDQHSVIHSLEKRSCPFDHAVADMMKKNLE
jgi:transcriptional regulator